MTANTYAERDLIRAVVMKSDDAGVTWYADPDGGGGAGAVTSVDGETGAVDLTDNYDALGVAAAGDAAHVAAVDPHPQYLTASEGNAAYQPLDADLTTLASSSALFLSLSDDTTATAMLTTLGLDTDLLTLSVPANTTITAAAASVLDDTTTAAMLTTLGAQPLDSDLTTIAGLTATTDNFMQAKAGAWASRTPTQVKADLFPAWTSYTPVITQGGAAETITTNDSRYIQIGKTVIGHVRVVLGSNGTANNAIFCTAPVASLYAGTGKNPQVGTGSYFDGANVWLHWVQFENTSSNAFVFRPASVAVGNVLLGDATLSSPTIGSGDVLAFFFMYEVA